MNSQVMREISPYMSTAMTWAARRTAHAGDYVAVNNADIPES